MSWDARHLRGTCFTELKQSHSPFHPRGRSRGRCVLGRSVCVSSTQVIKQAGPAEDNYIPGCVCAMSGYHVMVVLSVLLTLSKGKLICYFVLIHSPPSPHPRFRTVLFCCAASLTAQVHRRSFTPTSAWRSNALDMFLTFLSFESFYTTS